MSALAVRQNCNPPRVTEKTCRILVNEYEKRLRRLRLVGASARRTRGSDAAQPIPAGWDSRGAVQFTGGCILGGGRRTSLALSDLPNLESLTYQSVRFARLKPRASISRQAASHDAFISPSFERASWSLGGKC